MAKPLRISGRDWKGWLQIKPSAIPDAGRGLFARKDIPARTVLGEYHGRPIKTLRDIYALREDRYVIKLLCLIESLAGSMATYRQITCGS